jgi:hypothetical protein
MIKKVLVLTIAMMLALGAFGQGGLEDALKDMLESNGKLYLQPMTDAFGANMNSGWYHRSRVHKMLGFDLSFKSMFALIPSEASTFNFVMSENQFNIPISELGLGSVPDLPLSFAMLYADQDTEAPTVFGGDGNTLQVNNAVVTGEILAHLHQNGVDTTLVPGIRSTVSAFVGDTTKISNFKLPDGVVELGDIPFPIIMPQLAIGLPMGIEVTARGIPEVELKVDGADIGSFSALGLGVRMNIDQFIPIPLFPVDITAGAAFQSVSLTADDQELLKTMNTSINMQVGKSLSLLFFGLGVYADVAYETSSIDIAYTAEFEGVEQDIEFSTSVDPGLRYGAGLHLTFIPLTYVNVAYSMTPTNDVITIGAGISLR